MFDLNRTYFGDMKERAVVSGATITEEGTLLVYVADGSGGMAVQPCTAAASQRVAGWAITDALKYATQTVVEEVVVPEGGGSVTLSHQSIVDASQYVYNVTGAAAMTTETCPTPGSGEYCLVDATGVITFHADEAGDTVRISYRYNVTLSEILATQHERSPNNRAQDYFSSVSVGAAEGEIFTSMYDTSQAYAIGDPIYPGASGLVTSDSTAATIVGFVSQVPGVNDALLGIKYQIPAS